MKLKGEKVVRWWRENSGSTTLLFDTCCRFFVLDLQTLWSVQFNEEALLKIPEISLYVIASLLCAMQIYFPLFIE